MDVKPTRSELLKIKKKIKLAKSGYKLLKKKRDGLILEFFEILREAKFLRKELAEKFISASKKMETARILESDLQIRSFAMSADKISGIVISNKNIMGVVVPKIEFSEGRMHRAYPQLSNSVTLFEAKKEYQELLKQVLITAEIETSMKRLLNEIEKTKRRVNALEFEILPKLAKIQSFISLRLEEQERETIFRTKRIKSKASS